MIPQKTLSVVVPLYNEETNIQPFYDALTAVLVNLEMEAEIIFVDDGSTDESFGLIESLAKEDKRVKCIRLSRNFGSHPALTAGLRHANGDAAVMMSVDLQDPPELINELIRHWRTGFHVVWAVREGRDDPLLKKSFAAAFYKIFRRIALPTYPATGMDFGIFDRLVLDSFKTFNELHHFITGSIVWLGFRQTQVFYHRKARHSGISKWPIRKRVKNALDAIVSFSYFPIRFISYTGLTISFLSFAYTIFLVVRKALFGLGNPGWSSIMVGMLLLGGVQLTMLGIIGEYIWRSSEQARGRPSYIIMDSIGFSKAKEFKGVENESDNMGVIP